MQIWRPEDGTLKHRLEGPGGGIEVREDKQLFDLFSQDYVVLVCIFLHALKPSCLPDSIHIHDFYLLDEKLFAIALHIVAPLASAWPNPTGGF